MKKNDTEHFKVRFREYLKSKGLTCTSQREEILEYLIKDSTHFNADALIHSLRKKQLSVSRATVYRTLTHLVEAGFIREVAINSDQTHYEFIGASTHHEHIVCEICNSIIEFSDQHLEDRIEKIATDQKFLITRHTVQIFGVCRRCSEK
jgi:Fur family ferric uptake transcriptional regulator